MKERLKLSKIINNYLLIITYKQKESNKKKMPKQCN